MIIPSKKKAVSVIISQFRPEAPMNKMADGGEAPQDSEMPPHLEAKAAHADSMIDAMHNKDPHALVAAMDNFLREHELHQEEPEEEPSDYSPEKS